MPSKKYVQKCISLIRKGLSGVTGVTIRSGGWFEASLEHSLCHGGSDWAETLEMAAANPSNQRRIFRERLAP